MAKATGTITINGNPDTPSSKLFRASVTEGPIIVLKKLSLFKYPVTSTMLLVETPLKFKTFP